MGRLLGIAIWIITVASVWMFVSGRWWFPEAISEHGPRVDSQFMITIVVVGSTLSGSVGIVAIPLAAAAGGVVKVGLLAAFLVPRLRRIEVAGPAIVAAETGAGNG